MNSALLRVQVESALRDRIPSPFAYYRSADSETISIPALDRVAGGLPRGGLSEICGPESSGRTALLLSVLAEAMRDGEFCALVDGRDALDPHSAAAGGVDLSRLLWVRCRQVERALRSAELLLEGGGFGVVALDLAGSPANLLRRISLSVWFRLRWAVRNTRTALIVLEREPMAGTSASMVVRLETESVRWSACCSSSLPPLKDGRDRQQAAARALSETPEKTATHDFSRGPSQARLLSGFRSNVDALRSRHRSQPGDRASLMARAVWR
ncbi:MAG: hypothetical protein ACRD11_06910 [Terriglobia bacterium]